MFSSALARVPQVRHVGGVSLPWLAKRYVRLPSTSLFTLLMAAATLLAEMVQFFGIPVTNKLHHHPPIFC